MTSEEMLAVVKAQLDGLERKFDSLRSDLIIWGNTFNDELAVVKHEQTVQEQSVNARLSEKKRDSLSSKRRMLTSRPTPRF